MKKVLCLIDALSAGGAERQMVGLASLLKNQGYEVGLERFFFFEENFVKKYMELIEGDR